ncbi:glycosyltransferase family 39 protein [Patescibacteria group bacterium]|nr:glycosyltransferase family 39 protein [Patescibacteria group bacterium]MBU2543648.1 glycosyltransferase family 39 protein [Patescibacteria group bacterium]
MKVLKRLSLSQICLIILILIASFFRLYNLSDSLQFQGDQGRDAIIVSQIFTQRDLVFIGPVTSVGNLYLGPLYYYFMLPFLWLSYPSPIGPAYAIAILGIITVFLMYQLGKNLISTRAALIATIFFTFSSTVIAYTRFSWNPNPAPFVSAWMIFFTYKAWQKKPWYWIAVMVCLAVLFQLHYLALLSIGGAGVIWLISFFENWKEKNRSKNFTQQLKATAVGIFFLFLSFTPLVLFDYKHNWLNANAFYNLIFQDNNFKATTSSGLITKAFEALKETHGRGLHALFEIAIGQQRLLNTILLIVTLAILGWLLIKNKKDKHWAGFVVISAYLVAGIIGTAFYEHTVFDHYIAYLFPVTFWIYGIILDFLITKWKFIGKLISGTFIAYFLWFNLNHLPIYKQGWTIDDMQVVSDSIYQEIKPGEKYNLVLFSESRDLDAQNYRYFLTTTDRPPLKRESRGEAETLVVINEDHSIKNVADSPVYEIVVFPDKNPKKTLMIPNGPEIIILSTREDR